MSTVTIKWGKEKFPYEIDTSGTVAALKEGLKDRTGAWLLRRDRLSNSAASIDDCSAAGVAMQARERTCLQF